MDHRHLSQMDRNLAVEAQPPRQPANRATAFAQEIKGQIITQGISKPIAAL
jgi:hypothetical protein